MKFSKEKVKKVGFGVVGGLCSGVVGTVTTPIYTLASFTIESAKDGYNASRFGGPLGGVAGFGFGFVMGSVVSVLSIPASPVIGFSVGYQGGNKNKSQGVGEALQKISSYSFMASYVSAFIKGNLTEKMFKPEVPKVKAIEEQKATESQSSAALVNQKLKTSKGPVNIERDMHKEVEQLSPTVTAEVYTFKASSPKVAASSSFMP